MGSDATDANNILAAKYGIATYPAVSATKLRLGSTIGTAGSNMTELTGTGYTAGGTTVTWNAPAGQSTSNITAPSWTNGSGGAWSIVGLEIWDTAGTPKRHDFGSWTGQPITISNGSVFAVAAGAVTSAQV